MVGFSAFHISNPDMVRGHQVRAARALLDWSLPTAAARCGVGRNTISRLEKGHRAPGTGILQDIVHAFEEHGVVFINTDVGAGVLLNDRAVPNA